LVKQWSELKKLQTNYSQYVKKNGKETAIGKKNIAQHKLRQAFDPFFERLHKGLKQLDKIVRCHEKQQAELVKVAGKRSAADKQTKALKIALEALHAEVKNAESCYKHIHWLQERFPKAEYEDVTGLCKLATPDDVKEQDYSLNPGRYVGVVIEDDGKTEEEFVEEILVFNDELNALNEQAIKLSNIINNNIAQIVGEV
jgi:type I restriction enzyme M protein